MKQTKKKKKKNYKLKKTDIYPINFGHSFQTNTNYIFEKEPNRKQENKTSEIQPNGGFTQNGQSHLQRVNNCLGVGKNSGGHRGIT